MSDAALPQQLDRMITGYWMSQAIYAAAKFDLAERLHGGPKSVEDLAQATATNVGALYRLLRALASMGIFAEVAPRRFALTPMAELLREGVPGSKRALALMAGDEQFRAWGEIEYAVRTGRTGFEKVFGQPVFDYLGEHPDKARVFDAAMVGIHGREAAAILAAYDFSDIRVLADLGGGNGSQLIGILKSHPALHGILFDLPHVVERAKSAVEAAGVADRCTLVAGSFFEKAPVGADAYFMRHIIHDWNDEQALTILRHCRQVMPDHGRLLIVESVIPEGDQPFGGKLLDLVMLMIPGGKERTADEYRQLLSNAGFDLTRIVPTSTEISILEAKKAL